MTTQERTALFGGGDPTCVDPRILLLDRVLGNLPREEQSDLIIAVLLERYVWGRYQSKEAISLVEALEKLLENQEVVGFRAILMDICNIIPTQVEGDHHYDEEVEVAADLRLAMLGKVIEGWVPPSRFDEPPSHQVQGDAAICFRFLCDSYEKAPPYQRWGNYPNPFVPKEPGRIRKGILDLIRKHLETHRLPLEEFDLRIVQPAPDLIKLVLCHARIRQASMSLLQKEAEQRLQGA